MTIVSVKKEINPVEYLLNEVLPSSEYVQFYDAKSDMLKVSHHNSSLRCPDDRPPPPPPPYLHHTVVSLP